MFGSLTEKFKHLTQFLTSQKKLTEDNIADACKQVRLALLDADVNYSVVSELIKNVKNKALGTQLIQSVSPGEQFVKIIHDELVAIMGEKEVGLSLKADFSTILLCGLQGSGKTTTAAKLAYFLKKNEKKKVIVAACDLQRPAAIIQLKQLCAPHQIPVFSIDTEHNPVHVAQKSVEYARSENYDVLIIDTAGRLHLDNELMDQLSQIKDVSNPDEVLFVVNSNVGQEAVKIAAEFNQKISLTGTIVSMVDGTSRIGVAISIGQITQKPLKFEGTGEKITDLQSFHPGSMADRILGMGDIVNLVKKAQEQIDEQQALKLEEKLKKASFTYDDYLQQMKMLQRMGPLKALLQMLPGASQLPNLEKSEEELKKVEAIILSMTLEERLQKVDLIPSRRWRIYKGSGTTLEDVNRMVKNFEKMKQILKSLPKKSLENSSAFKKFSNFFG